MVKSETKGYIILALIIIAFITWFYWYQDSSDFECLRETATNYCESINMSLLNFDGLGLTNDFRCSQKGERNYYSEGFNFLDSEWTKCCDKRHKTFKWGCD